MSGKNSTTKTTAKTPAKTTRRVSKKVEAVESSESEVEQVEQVESVEEVESVKSEKSEKSSSTDVEDSLPVNKKETQKSTHIDEAKYEKLSSSVFSAYSNDDLACVLFMRFRKDGNPLARLALDIHRTIVDPFRSDSSRGFKFRGSGRGMSDESRVYRQTDTLAEYENSNSGFRGGFRGRGGHRGGYRVNHQDSQQERGGYRTNHHTRDVVRVENSDETRGQSGGYRGRGTFARGENTRRTDWTNSEEKRENTDKVELENVTIRPRGTKQSARKNSD
jgi:hypothetical protein